MGSCAWKSVMRDDIVLNQPGATRAEPRMSRGTRVSHAAPIRGCSPFRAELGGRVGVVSLIIDHNFGSC